MRKTILIRLGVLTSALVMFISVDMSAKQPYDELTAASGKSYAERYSAIKTEIQAGRANEKVDRLLIASMYAYAHNDEQFADSCVNLALDADFKVENLERYHKYHQMGMHVWFMPKVVARLANDAFLGNRSFDENTCSEEIVSQPTALPIDSTMTHYVEVYNPDLLPLCRLSNIRTKQGDIKSLVRELQHYREAYQVLTTKQNDYSDAVALAVLYRYLRTALAVIEYDKMQNETVHDIASDANARKIALLGEFQNLTIQNYAAMDGELAFAIADLAKDLGFERLAQFYTEKTGREN